MGLWGAPAPPPPVVGRRREPAEAPRRHRSARKSPERGFRVKRDVAASQAVTAGGNEGLSGALRRSFGVLTY